MKKLYNLQFIKRGDYKIKYIAFICLLIILEKTICTQTDYFGAFTIDYDKVNK